MNDFKEICRQPGIQHLAEIIRRHFDCHVGCISEGQGPIWLGLKQAVEVPVDVSSRAARSFFQLWFEKICHQQGMDAMVTCPDGGRALEIPISLSRRCVAAVIAVGREFRDIRLMMDLLTEIAQQIRMRAVQEMNEARPEQAFRHHFNQISGTSAQVSSLLHQLDCACEADEPVLIDGPEGSCHERYASAIHQNSTRCNGPFVVQHCGAMNEAFLESELFGHRRGAFPTAFSDKLGLFDIVDGGTLFLDEIEQLPVPLQIRLMDYLDTGQFVPVGSDTPKQADIRVIAASRRPLDACVQAGMFRSELYYRLSIIPVTIPVLRDRPEDIGSISAAFLSRQCSRMGRPQKVLAPETLDSLCQYDWPGDMLELENELERLIIFSAMDTVIGAELLSERIQKSRRNKACDVPAQTFEAALKPGQTLSDAMDDFERELISQVLRENEQNRTKAAEILGISRRNLIRKIESLHLED